MSWLAIAIVTYAVMVYALLHCSLTTEQALIIIGMSTVTTGGVWVATVYRWTLRLQNLRGKLESLGKQSAERQQVLKDLQEKVKAD